MKVIQFFETEENHKKHTDNYENTYNSTRVYEPWRCVALIFLQEKTCHVAAGLQQLLLSGPASALEKRPHS